jgi:DNA polymerase III delta subunit
LPGKSLLTYLDFVKEVKADLLKQVYYISASDNYFLNKAGEMLRDKLSGSVSDRNNFFVRYADETNVDEIIDLCQNYTSLFSDKKIVIVKKCEKLSRKLDDIKAYEGNPDPGTFLLLVFDKEYVNDKKLDKQHSFYNFSDLPEEDYQIWVRREFETRNCKIKDEELILFITSVPRNFDLIENEVMKMSNYYDDGDEKERIISKEVILKFIGYESEFTPYELMDAIMRKDIKKSMEIMDFLLNKGSVSPVFLLSVINGYYMDLFAFKNRGLNEWSANSINKYPLWGDKLNIVRSFSKSLKLSQLEEAFEKLKETDLKLKSSMIEPNILFAALVERLVNL